MSATLSSIEVRHRSILLCRRCIISRVLYSIGKNEGQVANLKRRQQKVGEIRTLTFQNSSLERCCYNGRLRNCPSVRNGSFFILFILSCVTLTLQNFFCTAVVCRLYFFVVASNILSFFTCLLCCSRDLSGASIKMITDEHDRRVMLGIGRAVGESPALHIRTRVCQRDRCVAAHSHQRLQLHPPPPAPDLKCPYNLSVLPVIII
jgi:hypothetical protein